MKDRDKEFLLSLVAAAVVGLFVVAIVIVQASYEAATFNRLTGGNATVWDAMWADLRVIGEVKQR